MIMRNSPELILHFVVNAQFIYIFESKLNNPQTSGQTTFATVRFRRGIKNKLKERKADFFLNYCF